MAKLYVTILSGGNLGIPAFRALETLSSSSTAHLPSQQSTAAPQDALDRMPWTDRASVLHAAGF